MPPLVLESAGALGIHNNETLRGGLLGKTRHAFGNGGVATPAVQNQNQRHPLVAASRFTRRADHVATRDAIMDQGLSLLGGSAIAIRGKSRDL